MPRPSISVIVPTFNGLKFFHTFFQAIKSQTLDEKDFETIVVDNGSTDESLKNLERYQSNLHNLKILSYRETQSSYDARNYGASKAHGKILAFTDIDCQAHPEWLNTILDEMKALEDRTIIAGMVNFVPSDGRYNLYEMYDTCTFLKQEAASKKNKGLTANLSISCKNFNRLRGFGSFTSGGDSEFCSRAVSAQYTITFMKNALVLHPTRSTHSEICMKARRVAKGIAETHIRNGSLAQAKSAIIQLAAFIILWDLWKRKKDLTMVGEKGSCSRTRYLLFCFYIGSYQRLAIIKNLITACLKK